MKYTFTILSILLLLSGCGPQRTRIEGSFENASGVSMVLAAVDTVKAGSIDTLRTNDQGHFSIHKKMQLPGFYSLSTNNQAITLALHPGDQVTITGDVRQLVRTYRVEGSEDSERIRQLSKQLQRTISMGDSLNNVLRVFRDLEGVDHVRRQLEFTYLQRLDSLRRYFIRSVISNPGALSSLYALYQRLPSGNFVFSQESDLTYFMMVDSALYPKFPALPYVRTLHANVLEMKTQLRAKQMNRMISGLGQQAKEIRLPDPSGKTVSLSSQRGKYVLLDFWAAWCAPCRAESPNLVANYDKYRNQNFTIFQVSLDQTRRAWTKAIEDDKLNWIHVSDLKFWESEAADIYEVEAIPANFLIDPDGVIIAKNLYGEALGKKLAEIFGY